MVVVTASQDLPFPNVVEKSSGCRWDRRCSFQLLRRPAGRPRRSRSRRVPSRQTVVGKRARPVRIEDGTHGGRPTRNRKHTCRGSTHQVAAAPDLSLSSLYYYCILRPAPAVRSSQQKHCSGVSARRAKRGGSESAVPIALRRVPAW